MKARCCVILLLTVIFFGCSKPRNSRDVIYSCSEFTVFTDSVVSDSGNVLAAAVPDARCGIECPRYSSRQTLINQLYEAGVEGIAGVSMNTRDICLSIYLSLAYIDPQRSMKILREMVSDGWMGPDAKIWPLAGNQAMWTVAAWEVYKVTGDNAWLREARDVTASFIDNGLLVCMDRGTGLFHGVQGTVDGSSGYCPQWMGQVDMYQAFWLAANVEYAEAIRILSKMDMALGSLETSKDYGALHVKLANDINMNFWMADKERYSSCLYGNLYPMQSPAIDLTGLSLGILFSVATDDMAKVIVGSTYLPVRSRPIEAVLWGLASAKANNNDALCAAIGVLCHSVLQSGDAIDVPALNFRVIAGMSFGQEGIRFAPKVPTVLRGVKVIDNFHYRGSVLRIEIVGTGSIVESFYIDDKVQRSPLVKSDIEGHHTVRIVLSGELDKDGAPENPRSPFPATTVVQWRTSGTSKILNYDDRYIYNVYVNGVYNDELEHSTFLLPSSSGSTVYAIEAENSSGEGGFACRPLWVVPKDKQTLVQPEYFVRRGTGLIEDKIISRRYVESTRIKNRSIKFYTDSMSEGEYYIDVNYMALGDSLISSDICPMRMLYVNGQRTGALIFPQSGSSTFGSGLFSNVLTAHLRQGKNTFEIVREVPYCVNDVRNPLPIVIDYVRMIRK